MSEVTPSSSHRRCLLGAMVCTVSLLYGCGGQSDSATMATFDSLDSTPATSISVTSDQPTPVAPTLGSDNPDSSVRVVSVSPEGGTYTGGGTISAEFGETPFDKVLQSADAVVLATVRSVSPSYVNTVDHTLTADDLLSSPSPAEIFPRTEIELVIDRILAERPSAKTTPGMKLAPGGTLQISVAGGALRISAPSDLAQTAGLISVETLAALGWPNAVDVEISMPTEVGLSAGDVVAIPLAVLPISMLSAKGTVSVDRIGPSFGSTSILKVQDGRLIAHWSIVGAPGSINELKDAANAVLAGAGY